MLFNVYNGHGNLLAIIYVLNITKIFVGILNTEKIFQGHFQLSKKYVLHMRISLQNSSDPIVYQGFVKIPR